MKLLISGLPQKASLDEIKTLVYRYSHADCSDIELVGEADERPAALIAIKGANWTALNYIRRRLHGMYWHRCRLSVQVLSFWDVSEAAEARRQTRTAAPPPM
ncbi:RNA-binding protein [Paraburkholderia sp. Tr-20389]|uniref:RNA-binding protein n=1 Tax=Paraburkholderia sp. Tr-20389 TaxID=2703903 RepID=UPI001980AF70|nr:RNA-binding protein [Paraburkholderia sp. Tr-20389]MBN3756672.1 RNA-binding protein [Paraburkholderia sp. Tr-20389]